MLGEDENADADIIGGNERWIHGHWWYKLAHVCQRWRNIVLGSAVYLGVSLVCTTGTPVADMLAHSPPLPLIIDYLLDDDDDIAPQDEKGAILAFMQRDRVRRVRLAMHAANLQKLVKAMDDEYPIMEYLIIRLPEEDKSSILIFPERFQAPYLRHLYLDGFALPTRSQLLTTSLSLVTICLLLGHPSTYFHPNTLLRWISLIPQLESLSIVFFFPVPNRDAERQHIHTPIMTSFTLPNLRFLRFQGIRSYLEALLHRISTPRLERFRIDFFNQLTFSVPRLLQFLNTTENLRFKSAKIEFSDNDVDVEMYPDEEAEMYTLSIAVNGLHLDWQVSSAAQIFNSLSPAFSAVEHLNLDHKVHSQSSEEHNEADPVEWRKLLSSLRNVKTLRIAEGLVEELSCCLELENGELPLELLPALQELTYSRSGDTGGVFTSFVDARQDAGRPFTLVRRSPSSDRGSSVSIQVEHPSIPSAGDEAVGDLNT